jgi:hypothetical protein
MPQHMITITIFVLVGVTSCGYSCGICKYKAHKACASNVVVSCKWTTLNSVDEKSVSCENVSRSQYNSHMHCALLFCETAFRTIFCEFFDYFLLTCQIAF